GVYKHVQLNGYYEKGDTPAPIEYTLSTDNRADNGGSIIVVSDIKLEHLFKSGVVYTSYFGSLGDGVFDNSQAFQDCINFMTRGTIIIPSGVYNLTTRLTFPVGWQTILEGEARLARRGTDFGRADGLVKINWNGDPSEESVMYYEDTSTFDGQFKNFYLRNNTGVRDIDGIVFNSQFTTGYMENVLISGFDNGLTLRSYTYYTEITGCAFHNNNVGVLNESEGTERVLANGCLYRKCQFSLNEIGYKGVGVGEIINFQNCYVELNRQYGMEINGGKAINISGT